MNPRLATIGCLIVVLGVAVCYGAAQVWPTDSLLSLEGALRILGALVAALLGVGNVVAGAAILLMRR